MNLPLKVILERDPLGAEHSLEIERVWLLAVIDVATRCVLGWSLGVGRECDRLNAIETMKQALVPATTPELSLPGLRLMPSGGFVSQALPQTQFACWRQIRSHNARAHPCCRSDAHQRLRLGWHRLHAWFGALGWSGEIFGP